MYDNEKPFVPYPSDKCWTGGVDLKQTMSQTWNLMMHLKAYTHWGNYVQENNYKEKRFGKFVLGEEEKKRRREYK